MSGHRCFVGLYSERKGRVFLCERSSLLKTKYISVGALEIEPTALSGEHYTIGSGSVERMPEKSSPCRKIKNVLLNYIFVKGISKDSSSIHNLSSSR